MTPTRVILGVVAIWIALIVLTAWVSMLAALLGYLRQAEALHHTSWMFVLSGAMGAAAGLVVYLVWELKNDAHGWHRTGKPAPSLQGRIAPVSSRFTK